MHKYLLNVSIFFLNFRIEQNQSGNNVSKFIPYFRSRVDIKECYVRPLDIN